MLRHTFVTTNAGRRGRPARRADRRPTRRPAHHHALRPSPKEPRPTPQLHPRRLYGLRHIEHSELPQGWNSGGWPSVVVPLLGTDHEMPGRASISPGRRGPPDPHESKHAQAQRVGSDRRLCQAWPGFQAHPLPGRKTQQRAVREARSPTMSAPKSSTGGCIGLIAVLVVASLVITAVVFVGPVVVSAGGCGSSSGGSDSASSTNRPARPGRSTRRGPNRPPPRCLSLQPDRSSRFFRASHPPFSEDWPSSFP